MWYSKWGIVDVLYLFSRYSPFIDTILAVEGVLQRNWSVQGHPRLTRVMSCCREAEFGKQHSGIAELSSTSSACVADQIASHVTGPRLSTPVRLKFAYIARKSLIFCYEFLLAAE